MKFYGHFSMWYLCDSFFKFIFRTDTVPLEASADAGEGKKP